MYKLYKLGDIAGMRRNCSGYEHLFPYLVVLIQPALYAVVQPCGAVGVCVDALEAPWGDRDTLRVRGSSVGFKRSF